LLEGGGGGDGRRLGNPQYVSFFIIIGEGNPQYVSETNSRLSLNLLRPTKKKNVSEKPKN